MDRQRREREGGEPAAGGDEGGVSGLAERTGAAIMGGARKVADKAEEAYVRATDKLGNRR
jgi:hypothetical protein